MLDGRELEYELDQFFDCTCAGTDFLHRDHLPILEREEWDDPQHVSQDRLGSADVLVFFQIEQIVHEEDHVQSGDDISREPDEGFEIGSMAGGLNHRLDEQTQSIGHGLGIDDLDFCFPQKAPAGGFRVGYGIAETRRGMDGKNVVTLGLQTGVDRCNLVDRKRFDLRDTLALFDDRVIVAHIYIGPVLDRLAPTMNLHRRERYRVLMDDTLGGKTCGAIGYDADAGHVYSMDMMI